jgi:hypothetical protein
LNRQQKTLVIVLCGVLALVLLLILFLSLRQPGGGDLVENGAQITEPAPVPTQAPLEGLSEEEIGRQAMLEEEDEELKDVYEEPVD